MTVQLVRCSARRLAEQKRPLVQLLVDVVADGASVGFLPPLPQEEAAAYWVDVEAELAHGHRELLLAEKDGLVVGTVQLELARKPNARHRAEVTKLLVHPTARRQGVARLLLQEVEQLARSHGRTLLHLDTREGDAAEQLYVSHGYRRVGRIPDYVRNEHGKLEATVVYYRVLEGAPG
jgi:acetyltransferase